MTTAITEGSVQLGGLTFGVLECGPPGGPLVLCLHGFPDTAWSFRHLLPQLAEAGFFAVAPYLRGYSPSSTSPDGRYPIAALINDTVRLHEHFGGGADAALVGHDWGAPIAYGAAAFAPRRFGRVVGLAIPPTGAFVQGLLDFDQLQLSFYMFFFQTVFAEGVVAANDFEFLARLWGKWSPGYGATEDLARVRAALARPENLSAALGYYRAAFDFSPPPDGLELEAGAALAAVPQPTLYLHGRDDGCFSSATLEREDVAATLRGLLGPGSEVATLDGLGHWLHLEAPDLVNQRIVSWLTEGLERST
jgi:pimeloyl-ACP methyl ester carboxylesterase